MVTEQDGLKEEAKMSRVLVSLLVIIAMASVAVAGIPDPTLSTIALDTQAAVAGLMTCPAGDARCLRVHQGHREALGLDPDPGHPVLELLLHGCRW
jgi:hypothetical protein